MNLDDVQRVSWSVGQRLPRADQRADRAFTELLASCGELVGRSFREDEGFEFATVELSGPIEGARYVVRRGRLLFVLSIQRFERAHTSASRDAIPLEIRLVGSMGVLAAPRAGAPAAGWGVAGCAIGTLGLAALALTSTGILSAWLQAALLLPALVAWRACATIAMARSMRRQAELQAAAALAHPAITADVFTRWRTIAPALTAERDLVGQRLGLPPFRTPARAIAAGDSSASSAA